MKDYLFHQIDNYPFKGGEVYTLHNLKLALSERKKPKKNGEESIEEESKKEEEQTYFPGHFYIDLFQQEPNRLNKWWTVSMSLTFKGKSHLPELYFLKEEEKNYGQPLTLAEHFYYYVTSHNESAQIKDKIHVPNEKDGPTYSWRFFRRKRWQNPSLYHKERDIERLNPTKTLFENKIQPNEIVFAKRVQIEQTKSQV